ncbi:septum site-determining protein MinC [Deinococcus misasensis]|uniref:septum site-determining protein MinC n=1 Tax=Deinococcus misasensis TaxID=392413 RepID=UPI000551166C|nr:septum site-determining protein MinC [Deinococcus misasensis]
MKLRGTLSGLSLLLDSKDTIDILNTQLRERAQVLSKAQVSLEIEQDIGWHIIEHTRQLLTELGAELKSIRPSVANRAPAQQTSSAPSGSSTSQSNTPAAAPAVPATPSKPILPPQTRILTQQLRSGMRIEHPGSLVVVGDVNPGVELIAGGDVIVTGALRGMAHAGAHGNETSVIWARPIASPQIRIGKAVARAPEGKVMDTMRRNENFDAEMARLEDDHIVIEVVKSSKH